MIMFWVKKIESNKINQDQEFVIQKKFENTEEIKLLETADKTNLENNNISLNNDTNVNSSSIADISDSTDNIDVVATIDGTSCTVPLDPNNRHYEEILKQVKEGTLTIKDAD